MKKTKSLACLVLLTLLGACHGYSSATFSSTFSSETPSSISSESSIVIPSSSSSSLSSSSIELTSSIISSSIPSSSSEISSSNSVSSSEPSSSSASSSLSSETSSSSSASSSSSSSYSSSSSSESSTSSTPIEPPTSYYDGYYKNLVSWTDGEDLKNQLNAIIRNGYQPLSYTKSNKPNYDTNIHADHSKDDFEYLDVIYSDKNSFKTETNKGWQREHAWCASLMCGSETGNAVAYKGRATDFHNLFAAGASGNQSRGNKNYGYADVFAPTYKDEFLVDEGNDGYSYDNKTFEPGDIDKGRLARAIFYMATMYKDRELDTANNITMQGLRIVEEPVSYVAGNDCAFAIGNLIDLLEWNEDYAVDYLEMQHNISVYTNTNNPDGVAQGNRNPYVDYPGLVDYVYGSKKNEPGNINDIVPSIISLGNEEKSISHFALKEAKREFGLNEKLETKDYSVCMVLNDFSVEDAAPLSSIGHSLMNHVFTESDGDMIEAIIHTSINDIKYQIILNPMGLCSSGTLMVTTTGIDKKSPDTNQSITFGNVPFSFNFSTTFSDVSTTGMTINNISAGGITVGSNNRVLTQLILTTKDSYCIDKAFVKAQAGNATSNYSLIIKVGTALIYSGTVNDSTGWKVFGGSLDEPVTGQVSYIFTGSSCLKLNSIAFNALIA